MVYPSPYAHFVYYFPLLLGAGDRIQAYFTFAWGYASICLLRLDLPLLFTRLGVLFKRRTQLSIGKLSIGASVWHR